MDVVELPELVSIASWYLWWQRRLIVRQEPVQPPTRTGQPIRALALNFVRASCKMPVTPHLNRWKKPLQNQLALNVDAAFSDDDNMGACDAVIRDSAGMFVCAATAKLDHVPDAFTAEAAALVEGLKLANSVGCNSILVQMDCLNLVESLQQNTGHSTIAAPILEDCRLLLLNFGKVILKHCNRESNMVAHVLAQNGRVDPLNLWLDSPPAFILELLADDVSVG
ncbi:hypothetical protein VPH35_106843 [Triticum aestivum]